jgi:DNA-binding PadR family transcriptional regulator
MDDLTYDEASVLSLIERMQPVTAYQIRKSMARSPTSNISNSSGKIYPIIRRLKERGLLAASAVAGDLRKAEQLTCTDAGKQMIRKWVKTLGDSHLLLEDPLRTKILSFHLLSKSDQVRWLKSVRADLVKKQAEIETFAQKTAGPVFDLAHANARLTTGARIAWVDQALQSIEQKS